MYWTLILSLSFSHNWSRTTISSHGSVRCSISWSLCKGRRLAGAGSES